MARSKDKAKRDKLAKAFVGRIEKAGAADHRLGVVNPDILRKKDPTLANVLDEYIRSKSWRTDIQSTAKQVAEALVARDKSSKLSSLLSALEAQLEGKPGVRRSRTK